MQKSEYIMISTLIPETKKTDNNYTIFMPGQVQGHNVENVLKLLHLAKAVRCQVIGHYNI